MLKYPMLSTFWITDAHKKCMWLYAKLLFEKETQEEPCITFLSIFTNKNVYSKVEKNIKPF